MPLYRDILSSNTGEASRQSQASDEKSPQQASNAGLKLLQSHLISKKRAKQAQIQPNKLIKTSEKPQLLDAHWTIDEEYDPMTPNSYEILQLAHIKAEEQRLAARKSGTRIDLSILDALDRLDDADEICPTASRSTQGVSIAPPPIFTTSIQSDHSEAFAQTTRGASEKLDGRSAAAKIMAKMGYKSGEGLGKDNQGISSPLEVDTSSTNVARIVQKQTSVPDSDNVKHEPKFTRILLLQNMVGPGEVDGELEAETKEECTKYGQVLQCLIYEITNKRVPDYEAVRIFVKFRDPESTGKAIADLNGRYFGGRVVKATCYDENKFNRYELSS